MAPVSYPTDEWMTYMDADLYRAAAKSVDVGKLKDHLSEDGLGDQLTPQGNNLLHIASQFGQLRSVEVILGQLRSSKSMFLLKQRNLKGDTALHLAAREGHHKVVKALIEATGPVGNVKALKLMAMKNKEGGTALHEAVRYNHEEVVRLLVEGTPPFTYGADCTGFTPLDMAGERQYTNLETILEALEFRNSPAHGGTMDTTPLHEAVKKRDVERVRRILQRDPSQVNKVDAKGWSPLHHAARLRDNISTEAILDTIKTQSLDKSVIYLGIKEGNRTALHIASWVGSQDIVERLLKHAPDCSEQVDAEGRNVFHFAMMNNYCPQLGSALLKKHHELKVRGLVNEKDAQGHTPYRLLASSPNISSFRGSSSGYDNDPPFKTHELVDKKERSNQKEYTQEKEKEKVKMPTLP